MWVCSLSVSGGFHGSNFASRCISKWFFLCCVPAGVQEKMGVMNRGVVYALWDYEPQSDDELGFSEGDCMTVLRREDEVETEWWWARCGDREGYIPRNLLGVSSLRQENVFRLKLVLHLHTFRTDRTAKSDLFNGIAVVI